MTLKTIFLCLDQNAISHQLTKFHTIPTLLPKFMHCEFLAPLLFQECICYLFYIKDTCWTWLQACPSLFFLFGKNDRHGRSGTWLEHGLWKKKKKKGESLKHTVPPSHTNLLLLLPAQDGIRPNLLLFCDIPLLPFYFVRVSLG